MAFPAYRAGGPTHAASIAPAAALVVLVGHCTNLPVHGQAGLETLADIVGRAPAYELAMGGLDEAVGAVDALVAELPTRS